ncbi:MAG TPA: ferrochelatase, partial [bacterium]|nr:ferrochelatase [bacterium]
MNFDHLLVIGFGAPEKQEDVSEFLRIVTRGVPVPEERLREVARHYEAIGGGSPYNRHTGRLIEAMKKELSDRAISLPVFTGMRNWHPFLKDTLGEIKKKGFRKGIGIVLAPHRSEASWDKYLRTVEEAKKESGAAMEYEYLRVWHDHPGFIDAQADQVKKVYEPMAHLLFSAHSIPVEMAKNSKYAEEIKISSQLVARKLNHKEWSVAYQSRSGRLDQPWLGPDVNSRIRELTAAGTKTVLTVPIGFLCDNAEVLFDLDIEAREEAEKAGVRYLRASTVMDHPSFAGMLAELIREKIK